MLIACNEGCKRNFELAKFKEKKLKNSVVETYFKCPHCHKRYTCLYTDKEIRRLQAQLTNKWGKASRREIEELHLKIKIKMDNLKEEMLGAQ
ncbi:hypothetical protein [Clostridium botulinum]|uniref:hypothetical protein n=1 Tax=Clostridium botulinum TaxID=1491 RepID=UPI00059E684D|nr:hypothetical protein [Clostridium botulinum]KIN79935.1 hypothetical protein SD74_18160 [Clostridium botulinum]MCC5426418.1 hypothetical protein [Clostridium botulinum]